MLISILRLERETGYAEAAGSLAEIAFLLISILRLEMTGARKRSDCLERCQEFWTVSGQVSRGPLGPLLYSRLPSRGVRSPIRCPPTRKRTVWWRVWRRSATRRVASAIVGSTPDGPEADFARCSSSRDQLCARGAHSARRWCSYLTAEAAHNLNCQLRR